MGKTNWQVKSLGDVTKVKSGYAFKSEDYLECGVRLVRIGNLNGSGLEFRKETVFVEERYLVTCSEFLLKENDVLIAMSGATTGKLALVKHQDLPCLLNQRVGLISILSDQVLNAKYLFYFLAKGDLRKEVLKIAGGSAQPNISPTQIMSFKIPLPPLPIQKQIAEILERADKAKQKRKEANKLTDEFLQSVFIEMFGDPVKNPKGWEINSFDKLVEKFQYGTSVKSSPNGIPVLRIPNVIQGVVDLSDLKSVELSQKEQASLVLNNGDILFVRTNGNPYFVGRCALFNLESKYVFASYLIRAIVKKKNVNSLFLVYLLGNSNYRNVIRSKCSTTAGQFNINTKGLGSLPIIIPPLSLQQQFAEIVNKTEALKEKQKQSEQELGNLFQSLMQKAFKGELV